MKNKEGLLGIAEQIQELDNLEKEIYQLKQEKGQLSHDLSLLKKSKEEELNNLSQKKQKYSSEIAELEKIVANLQAKRNILSTDTIPEIEKLNSLKGQINKDSIALEAKQESINRGFENLSKEQAKIEEKKKALGQILELVKQL